jgi:capsular polysaccharide biosynthesis protein
MAVNEFESGVSAAYYISVFRRRRWVIVTCAGLGLALGLAYGVTKSPSYTANSSVQIKAITEDPFLAGDIDRQINAQTEASLMDSTVVAELAAGEIDGDATPDELIRKLTVENPPDTQILIAHYTASTPERAQQGSRAFAEAYLEYKRSNAEANRQKQLNALDTQVVALNSSIDEVLARLESSPDNATLNAELSALRSDLSDVEADIAQLESIDIDPGEVIRPARLPTAPDGVSLPVTLVALTVLGAFAGLGAALVRHRTDRYLRHHDDFAESFGFPPISEIAPSRSNRASSRSGARGGGDARPVVVLPRGHGGDAFRELRLRLWPRRPAKIGRLLVAGIDDAARAGTLAANLAVSLSQAEWNVLLIWPDRRTDMPNLTLIAERDLVAILPWSEVALGDSANPDPTRLVSVIESLSERYDVVIVPGPPLAESVDSLELSSEVDAVLLTFNPARQTRDQLHEAMDSLKGVGASLAGVVIDPLPKRW